MDRSPMLLSSRVNSMPHRVDVLIIYLRVATALHFIETGILFGIGGPMGKKAR
jgi:hypothetical protein